MTFKFDWNHAKGKSGSSGSDITSTTNDGTSANAQTTSAERGVIIEDRDSKRSQTSSTSNFFSRSWSWARSSKKSSGSDKAESRSGGGESRKTQVKSQTSIVGSSSTFDDDADDVDDETELRRRRDALNSFTFKFGRTHTRRESDIYGISPRNSYQAIFDTVAD